MRTLLATLCCAAMLATFFHGPVEAGAITIFDNTVGLSLANTSSNNSQSGSNRFIQTTGSGTGSGNAVAIPLMPQISLMLDSASLQISATSAGTRSIGFYLYEASATGTAGNGANLTQVFTPNGTAKASAIFNVSPTSNNDAYSTFDFTGTGIGSYTLSTGTSYLLMAGNQTTANSLPMTFGSSTSAETPGTINLITWNTSASVGGPLKTDTFTTTDGGQNFNRNATTSTLWKITGHSTVPEPTSFVMFSGLGLAFIAYRRRRQVSAM